MVKHHIALGLAKAHSTADTPLIGGGIDIAKGRPVNPVTLVRPHAAARAARFFVEKFPGRSMYAVKANPSPELLQILWDNGITHYDVASIAEVRLVARTLPEATLCFMHPVKAEEAIAEAYFTHGVRTFSLDSLEELDKVVRATREATDLTLCVRLRVSSEHSKLSLASKFGAAPHEAKELLFAARQAADALGICFHVGSQAMTPEAYSNAMERVRAAIVEAAVTVDVIDVGGGFPSSYPGMEPPPLERFFETIHRAFESLPVSYSSELWCEPGRALCAEYSSIIVRVEKRRGTELYINDGAYGALFDAAHIGWRFPVELLREPDSRAKDMEFSFYGPTCDDMDHMAGPFLLPADIQAGDYIEIGMLGAYGSAMRTAFNGFGSDETVIVTDEPMVSLYDERYQDLASNVVTL
ncbi:MULTISPECIES: type III PLP-dependent enzyme [Sphingomonas]|uniref:ornithine decarboxylase n=1 Tax=Sphingomonas aerolata TaxID=185951 RepID=A0A2T4YRE9_9SPHN|nr:MULTISPECIES: type III PLP-dependent enzyme [Sphingomonas]KQM99776.1 decarboxylase [Sphingomonas sp. Leaf226]MBB3585752.1 ornithine decarboxylase [Sphingomonas sp. BK481]MBD8639285.1 type III PLP-dependent enzyme [Sphingomonas sp. CFBP 13733]MBD8699499.1 type III PLP-dependent enzyme [Sphingomonas sp. CFBP 13714]MBD8735542.1 type III PLP-dependent enzyme [Sphingomonas sp. CFBP 13706]